MNKVATWVLEQFLRIDSFSFMTGLTGHLDSHLSAMATRFVHGSLLKVLDPVVALPLSVYTSMQVPA